jgi:hypothetical protein
MHRRENEFAGGVACHFAGVVGEQRLSGGDRE